MARPRNALAQRKPCGRIKQLEDDPRDVVARQRVKHLGVREYQSKSFLSGFLVGILFLKRRLTLEHLAHYYSFLQNAPKNLKAIEMKEKVQTFTRPSSPPFNTFYFRLTKELGRDINILHALVNNQLIAPLPRVRRTLEAVPLTDASLSFMHHTEHQLPAHYRPRSRPRKKGRKFKRFRRR